MTSASVSGTSYPGRPSGSEFDNYVGIMGYSNSIAHQMTRWDFTMEASLQLWATAGSLGAIPVSYTAASATNLPYSPIAPASAIPYFRWWEMNHGSEPRVHAIRVSSPADHAFPMSAVPAMGTAEPALPWYSWNLAQYVLNFFLSFP